MERKADIGRKVTDGANNTVATLLSAFTEVAIQYTHGAWLGMVHVATDGIEVLVVAAIVHIVVDTRHLTKGEKG